MFLRTHLGRYFFKTEQARKNKRERKGETIASAPFLDEILRGLHQIDTLNADPSATPLLVSHLLPVRQKSVEAAKVLFPHEL